MTDNANAAVAIILRTGPIPVFLRRALNDVLEQTFSDWTAIVVNDGGPREPVDEAIAAVADRSAARIRVVHHESPLGREAALNHAVQNSGSRYVAVHDDTDTWAPAFLAETVDFLNRSEELAVATRTAVVHEQLRMGEILEQGREPLAADKAAVTFHEVLQRNFTPPISMLYARALYEKVGFYDPASGDLADWEFLLRALAHGPIGFLDGVPLAFWHRRVQPGIDSGSSTEAPVVPDAEALIRDRLLRQDLGRHGGLGALLTVADEFRRLHETTHAQTAHLSAADLRLEANVGELGREVGSGHNRLAAQLDLLLTELTALSHKVEEQDRLSSQIGDLQRQVFSLERRIKSRTLRARVRAYVRAASRYTSGG